MARFAVFGDAHDADLAALIDEVNSQKPDAVLMTGDLRGYTKSNEAFFRSFEQLAKNLNRQAYLIPGSHDYKSEWRKAFLLAGERKEYLVDLSGGRPVEVAGVMLIPYGGATWLPIPPNEAFRINPLLQVSDLAVYLARAKGRPTALMMHEPLKMYGDVAEFFEHPQKVGLRMPAQAALAQFGDAASKYIRREHVGNEQVQDLVEGRLANPIPDLTVFGHIHENYKFGPRGQEVPTQKPAEQNVSVKNLSLNPGAFMDGFFGLVNVSAGEVSYNIKKL